MGKAYRSFHLALLLFVLHVASAPATSRLAPEQRPINASDGWVKVEPNATASAFVVIENPTMYDVYIVKATADVADEVAFRDSSPPGDPQDLKEAIAPAYGQLEMKADGVHLVLSKLKQTLRVGDAVLITLTTDGGITLQVATRVRN
jgi:copper(I)-binding protein